jgi:zinc protease
VNRLRNDPVDREELDRAKNQVLARYLYEGDSVTEQAHQLGFFATVHEYRFAFDFPDRLEDVSPERVMEVARKYLSADSRTVGWFVATEESRTGSHPAGFGERRDRLATFRELHAQSVLPDSAMEFTPPDFSNMVPVRKVLDNGLAVIALRNPISETAHVTATIRAGSVVEPEGKYGVSTLTVRSLLEGAGTMTGEELNRNLEAGGTQLSTDVGYDYTTVDIDLLTKKFEDVMSLLGDTMMDPHFPDESIDRLKKEMWTEIREEEENEYIASMMALRELIYPADHPYARRVLGKRETLDGITVDDVKRFHERHYNPVNVSIVVVGDIEPDVSIRAIENVFGGWEGPTEPVPYDLPPTDRQDKSRVKVVSMEEKTQVSLVLGHLGIRRDNPDYVPIQIMNNILGDIGIGGRLGRRVREEMGNAYFIFSSFSGGAGQSPFFIMAGIAPDAVEETRDAILKEVKRMSEKGLTQEEFTISKQNLIGSLALDLEENQGIAEILAEMEFHSLGLDYLESYPQAISSTSIDQVQRVAAEYLDSKHYSLALAGPIDEDLNVLESGEE